METLEHLKGKPDAEEDVLVVDFGNLAAVNAVISNVSDHGCRLTSPDAKELHKTIGILTENAGRMVKAQVTSVKGNDAAVIFQKPEQANVNKRREKRNSVNFPVKIADLEGLTEITGKIVDAGNNGCRIMATGLAALPEEVVLTMKNFDRPVVAEFAWRNETSAGMRLLWDRTLEQVSEEEADQAMEEEMQSA